MGAANLRYIARLYVCACWVALAFVAARNYSRNGERGPVEPSRPSDEVPVIALVLLFSSCLTARAMLARKRLVSLHASS